MYLDSTFWQTVLNLGPAWLADDCAAKTNKYSNKPAKVYERMIRKQNIRIENEVL